MRQYKTEMCACGTGVENVPGKLSKNAAAYPQVLISQRTLFQL